MAHRTWHEYDAGVWRDDCFFTDLMRERLNGRSRPRGHIKLPNSHKLCRSCFLFENVSDMIDPIYTKVCVTERYRSNARVLIKNRTGPDPQNAQGNDRLQRTVQPCQRYSAPQSPIVVIIWLPLDLSRTSLISLLSFSLNLKPKTRSLSSVCSETPKRAPGKR
jgi:hypothetical protein